MSGCRTPVRLERQRWSYQSQQDRRLEAFHHWICAGGCFSSTTAEVAHPSARADSSNPDERGQEDSRTELDEARTSSDQITAEQRIEPLADSKCLSWIQSKLRAVGMFDEPRCLAAKIDANLHRENTFRPVQTMAKRCRATLASSTMNAKHCNRFTRATNRVLQ